jgi:hypothetical protein
MENKKGGSRWNGFRMLMGGKKGMFEKCVKIVKRQEKERMKKG